MPTDGFVGDEYFENVPPTSAPMVECVRCHTGVERSNTAPYKGSRRISSMLYPYPTMGPRICLNCVNEATDLTVCSYCGGVTTHTETMFSPTGEQICYSCFDDNFVFCTSCDTILNRDDAQYYEDEEGYSYYCSNCYNRIHNCTIRRYHSVRKDRNFFALPDEDTQMFLGVELEVEFPMSRPQCEMEEDAKHIQQMFPDGFMFFEYDSSINFGYEIVTAPMTYAFFKDQKKNFVSMLKYLSYNGYKSHDTNTCGLHIHVGYNAFGEVDSEIELNITKLLLFTERNFDELERIARRDRASCERWSDKYGTMNKKRLNQFAKADKYTNNKYRAINLCNSNTTEFRIFRGTLFPSTFISTVDFVVALVEISKLYSLRDMEDITGFANLFAGTDWEGVVGEFVNSFATGR